MRLERIAQVEERQAIDNQRLNALSLRPTLDTVPAPVDSVDFAGQEALSFRIENRTDDPGSPAVGQIWLRTDL